MLLAKSARNILRESQHPALGCLRAETEAMRDGGRYDDGGRRLERDHLSLERHLAAASGDQQDLKQVAVAVGPDRPVVDRGARRDSFDVNEVERLIVRRIAVEVEQWQGGASRHGRSVAHFGRRTPKRCAPASFAYTRL